MRNAIALLLLGVAGVGCARASERDVVARLVHALQAHDSASVHALAAPGTGRDLWASGSSLPPGYVANAGHDLRIKFVGRRDDDATYYVPARGTGRCTVGIIVSVVTFKGQIRVRGIDFQPDLVVPPDVLPC